MRLKKRLRTGIEVLIYFRVGIYYSVENRIKSITTWLDNSPSKSTRVVIYDNIQSRPNGRLCYFIDASKEI
jgi:hypothetical protein